VEASGSIEEIGVRIEALLPDTPSADGS